MPDASAARIIVVDDEVPQMKALCNTLRDQGYSTTGFVSAREALDAIRNDRFDLLLTDLMMPEMDGISLLRAVREVDRDLVGVVMTGHGTIDSAVEAMKVGALDYILKPFKLSIILPVLSRALSIRSLRMENAALAERVRLRTSELEAANRELESFSYSVAHDLRAPLRAIDGFASMLAEDFGPQLPQDAHGLLETIVGSTKRMGQLIDGLLRLSRMGRRPLSPQPVSMSILARDVVAELERQDPAGSPRVTVMELPDAVGDQALLRQVFINLVSNAFKFSRGRAEARVEIGCDQQDGVPVYYVRDNGAGFDMRYAEKLFGVFQRLHRVDEFEGTGVGLSIVQRIIHRHGGRVWAQAEVGQGATFFFTLQQSSP